MKFKEEIVTIPKGSKIEYGLKGGRMACTFRVYQKFGTRYHNYNCICYDDLADYVRKTYDAGNSIKITGYDHHRYDNNNKRMYFNVIVEAVKEHVWEG